MVKDTQVSDQKPRIDERCRFDERYRVYDGNLELVCRGIREAELYGPSIGVARACAKAPREEILFVKESIVSLLRAVHRTREKVAAEDLKAVRVLASHLRVSRSSQNESKEHPRANETKPSIHGCALYRRGWGWCK